MEPTPTSVATAPLAARYSPTRRRSFAGREIVTSIYDAELEHDWGAVYLQHMQHPLLLPSQKDRPNVDYLKYAVAEGAIVHYQGGWSREVGLDALLGLVHTVNVCNNNFHMHRFQPRKRYSNLLEVEGFPIYPDTELGMMQMNTETYYRLLNWGLRLAAGAGSATGVKQVPVGYNRAYVQVDRAATLRQFNSMTIPPGSGLPDSVLPTRVQSIFRLTEDPPACPDRWKRAY